MNRLQSSIVWTVLGLLLLIGAPESAEAQTTTVGNSTSAAPTRGAALNDYLIYRLWATTEDQKSYVREICKLVEQGKLEKRTVIALERYARRKSPFFPLPVYERALRVQAAKKGVRVPTLKEIVARNGATAAQAVRDSRIR